MLYKYSLNDYQFEWLSLSVPCTETWHFLAGIFADWTCFSCQLASIFFWERERESDLPLLNTHKQIVNKPWKLTKPIPPAVVTEAELRHILQRDSVSPSCEPCQHPAFVLSSKDLLWKNIVGLIADHVELVRLECVFGQGFVRSVKKQQSCKHHG